MALRALICIIPKQNKLHSLRTAHLYHLEPTRFELWTHSSKYTSDQLQEQGGKKTWKAIESSILQEIRPIKGLIRKILHTPKYKDGELLSLEDEKEIIEKVLPYHPHAQVKAGCGVDSIMVGQHPQFGSTRCLFIIRKNGQREDFSYKKCLIGLIRKKYPSSAAKFIDRHFKQSN
ncbi:protein DCL homolog, chloroplastic [Cryptomeria japonica]|uniref:protein DCL homolog, chloroplastic n=1 Tax=Cryptomeria japonica TaxID=3369 RepID=UPI0027DA3F50|nr:protein DCL homolog, chloroplastic [Cryptomeria japonica]